jgi:hypothetical protein
VQIKPNQESYGQKQPEMTSQEQSEQTADFAPEPLAVDSGVQVGRWCLAGFTSFRVFGLGGELRV